MPEKWPMLELGAAGVEVLDCEHKTPRDAGAGLPYIAIPNLVDGRIKLDAVRRITVSDFREWTRRTLPKEGDIIVTRRGRVGDSAVVPAGLTCAIGQNLVVLRSNGTLIDQKYLRWAARGDLWFGEVDRLHNVGAIFDSLNVGELSQIRISIPPKRTQRAIARLLDALDDKIIINDRCAASCNALAQAISMQAHLGSAYLRLTDMAAVTMGSSPPGTSYNEDSAGLPFYQGTRDFGERFPRQRVWCTAPVRTARKGSTLVSVRAPVGHVNVAREACCIGRGLAAIDSLYGTPSVLFHELLGSADVWAPYESEGTVFGSISKPQMENLRIAGLEREAAKALEATLAPLDRQVEAAFVENQTLRELRDTLLPRLMSGKIRVHDAEEIVEDVT